MHSAHDNTSPPRGCWDNFPIVVSLYGGGHAHIKNGRTWLYLVVFRREVVPYMCVRINRSAFALPPLSEKSPSPPPRSMRVLSRVFKYTVCVLRSKLIFPLIHLHPAQQPVRVRADAPLIDKRGRPLSKFKTTRVYETKELYENISLDYKYCKVIANKYSTAGDLAMQSMPTAVSTRGQTPKVLQARAHQTNCSRKEKKNERVFTVLGSRYHIYKEPL